MPPDEVTRRTRSGGSARRSVQLKAQIRERGLCDAIAVRRAVLPSRGADLMSTWTRSAWGADDQEMWLTQLTTLGPGSPLRPLATDQLGRLDRELGRESQPSGIRPRR